MEELLETASVCFQDTVENLSLLVGTFLVYNQELKQRLKAAE